MTILVAGVEDRHDVGCLRPAAARASRRNRRTWSGVARGRLGFRDFQRNVAIQLRVVGPIAVPTPLAPVARGSSKRSRRAGMCRRPREFSHCHSSHLFVWTHLRRPVVPKQLLPAFVGTPTLTRPASDGPFHIPGKPGFRPPRRGGRKRKAMPAPRVRTLHVSGHKLLPRTFFARVGNGLPPSYP